ncbi:MAG: hypothetical protein MO852_07890 [Candidatus Devosia euplotis]|nr:hypothetical protein [Candidatus Devosia euplotis]
MVDLYTWSATSNAAASVTLEGRVPDRTVRQSLAAHAGGRLVDASTLAAGAPEDFVAAAAAALDAVVALAGATARFGGTAWSLTRQAASIGERDGVLAALELATDIGAGPSASTHPILISGRPPRPPPGALP